MSALEAKL